jgi:hypothetical protein
MRARKWVGSIASALLAVGIPVAAFAQSTPRFDGRLMCSGAESVLKQGAFSLAVGRVRLVDGKACVKPFEAYRGCEWTVSLIQAERWGADAQFLVAAIEAIHDGPGADLSVLIFQCRGSIYASVFAGTVGSRGASLVLGPRSTFEVITGEWLPEDPGCCPSRERTTSYRWDERRRRFVQAGSKVRAASKRE